MRPNKIIHFDCCGDEARLCSPARAHAPPAKERSLSAMAHANRFLGFASAFGICIMQTNRKNINPSKVDDKRTNFLAVRLVAAASSAHPTKYAQKERPGIQDGTIFWTNSGPRKCSVANMASGTAINTQPKVMSLSQPRAAVNSFRRIKTPATK